MLKRGSSTNKNVRMSDSKDRAEISGTFQMHARRENMYAKELDLHERGPKYMREGGAIIDFGGQVTAVGRFDKEEKAELLNLVKNAGEVQAKKDRCDRILRVKSTPNGFVVYTTKPHLAVALGKKLHGARKGGELSIIWSRYDQPVRVLWIADID